MGSSDDEETGQPNIDQIKRGGININVASQVSNLVEDQHNTSTQMRKPGSSQIASRLDEQKLSGTQATKKNVMLNEMHIGVESEDKIDVLLERDSSGPQVDVGSS